MKGHLSATFSIVMRGLDPRIHLGSNEPAKNDRRTTPAQVRQGRDDMPPVFRFAPSPNGYLHLGHAFSALL
ncbi:glutamate--tRNA ligase family protein, partial [Bradyrhizobium sp. SZCCHNRI3043]|uniref:glutamate--tRNA ligase family protein n=1 Tax=Bradyrhizobium sp. SZCCHNRI3043 TaxID=3057292 RepID=UPI0028EBF7E3